MPAPSPLLGHDKSVRHSFPSREAAILKGPGLTSFTNACLLGHIWVLLTANIKLCFKYKTSTASNTS